MELFFVLLALFMMQLICFKSNCPCLESVNLARAKTVLMSSAWDDYVGSRAVDGDKNSDFFGNSCSHTDVGDKTPYLAVDLDRPITISHVRVTNRGDCCGMLYTAGGNIQGCT